MTTHPMKAGTAWAEKGRSIEGAAGVPWPIWVVVLLLGIEGIGNLLAIPGQPLAAFWLAAKALFLVGLIRGWRWVFVLFLIVAALHVVGFAGPAPIVALLNLALIVLVASTFCRFFPKALDSGPIEGLKPKLRPSYPGTFDAELDS